MATSPRRSRSWPRRTARPSTTCGWPARRPSCCCRATCRPVDTVGAGDAYMAGLLVGLAERRALTRAAFGALADADWLAVMRFASVAAALTCERAGADPPRRAEVEARLGAW